MLLLLCCCVVVDSLSPMMEHHDDLLDPQSITRTPRSSTTLISYSNPPQPGSSNHSSSSSCSSSSSSSNHSSNPSEPSSEPSSYAPSQASSESSSTVLWSSSSTFPISEQQQLQFLQQQYREDYTALCQRFDGDCDRMHQRHVQALMQIIDRQQQTIMKKHRLIRQQQQTIDDLTCICSKQQQSLEEAEFVRGIRERMPKYTPDPSFCFPGEREEEELQLSAEGVTERREDRERREELAKIPSNGPICEPGMEGNVKMVRFGRMELDFFKPTGNGPVRHNF
jgi:hypothetical protein